MKPTGNPPTTRTHPSHGPRISSTEYDRRVVALHSGRSAYASSEQELKDLRRELDITIDHRLGVDFPKDRRDALWEVQKEVIAHPLRLGISYLVRSAIKGRALGISAGQAGYLVEQYSRVLDDPELMDYFGLDASELRLLLR